MTMTISTGPAEAPREAGIGGGDDDDARRPKSRDAASADDAGRGSSAAKPGRNAAATGAPPPPLSPHPDQELAPTAAAASVSSPRSSLAAAAHSGASFMGLVTPDSSSGNGGSGGSGNGSSPTAEALARAVVAGGGLVAANASRLASAACSAVARGADGLVARTPPLARPVDIAPKHVARLRLVAAFSSPAAAAASVVVAQLGELAFWAAAGSVAISQQLTALSKAGGEAVLSEARHVLSPLSSPSPSPAAAAATAGQQEQEQQPLPQHRRARPSSALIGAAAAAVDARALKIVGAALLVAFAAVYDAVEEAAGRVLREAGAAGARYLAHSRGGDAGDAAAVLLAVLRDVLAFFAMWLRLLTGRALASDSALTAARRVLAANVPRVRLDD